MYINRYIGEIVVMAGQIYHPFREFLHIEQRRFRGWDMGKLAIRLNDDIRPLAGSY